VVTSSGTNGNGANDRADYGAGGPKAGSRTAGVTGASGYLGSIVARALTDDGFRVHNLVRRPRPDTDDRFFDLRRSPVEQDLDGLDVLVHCAYDFSVTSRSQIWESNVFGTRDLLNTAIESGVGRTIVVSSMSAYAGTKQIYGRAKLASELDALSRGMVVVRPGLVYGPGWGGMAGTLRKLASLPIVPLVARHARQFTAHEDDLCRAIVALANADSVPSVPLGLAHPSSVSFERLLTTFGESEKTGNLRFAPIPWLPLFWALRAVESTPMALPVRADSLLGLVRPAEFVPNVEELQRIGVSFRPFQSTPD
jgi:nucleoside-diphosphate-sugar epimerase